MGVGDPGFDELSDATAAIRSRLADDTSTDGRHERALLDLRWYRVVPASLDRALAQLEAAHRARPRDAAVLNDLAVVYLELAEREQSLLPMLRALDALELARAIGGPSAPVLFNRALLLERLYLVSSSRREWERYGTVERDGAWQREAREHAAALARVLTAAGGAVRAPGSVGDADAAAVRDSPRHSLELGIRVLGAWGRAVLVGDSARARAMLTLVRASLARDTAGSDVSTPRALQAIAGAQSSPRRAGELAAAHVWLAEGYRLYAEGRYERALTSLTPARRTLHALRSPLADWATLYLAACQLNLGRYRSADRLLRHLVADTATADARLASRARLVLGVSQVRRGNYERANALYREAAPFLERVRDQETLGYGAFLRAEGLARAGQRSASQAAGLHALRILAPLRRSIYLYNQLSEVADVARGEGLPHAALAVMGEVLDVATAIGQGDVMAVALCRRARDLYHIGRPGDAEADLNAATAWADRMPPGRGHARIRAAVQLTRGELARRTNPKRALPLLTAAVATFRGFDTDPYLPFALDEAALAADAAGDRALARAWLREAVRAAERMEAAFRGAGGRAVFADRVERISDHAIIAALEDGRADEAFAYLERAHTAAWPVGASRFAVPPSPAALGGALPADMLVAAYALLDDRVVVWSVTRRAVRIHSVPVGRDSVAALVEQFEDDPRAWGRPGGGGAAARLFDVLLRPLRDELTGVRRLTVVPDRELHRVSFAALWDRDDGRYGVEAFELREAPSAAFLLSALGRPRIGTQSGMALVVGEPALDSASAEHLGRLPGAAAEGARIAGLYQTGVLLTGAEAERGRVVAQLARASVLHFAGHAVFNPDRPELSYLALAGNGSDAGQLRAREIGALRLSKTRVAVLSACSTLNPRPTRAGAAAGLAYSFLSAGVPGTISTLWDVSDLATAELLVDLHRRLSAGLEPAAALRGAQLHALRSPNPLLRAPRTWGAFTYTGM